MNWDEIATMDGTVSAADLNIRSVDFDELKRITDLLPKPPDMYGVSDLLPMSTRYFSPEWRKARRRAEYLRHRAEGKTASEAWRDAVKRYGEPDMYRISYADLSPTVFDPRSVVLTSGMV